MHWILLEENGMPCLLIKSISNDAQDNEDLTMAFNLTLLMRYTYNVRGSLDINIV